MTAERGWAQNVSQRLAGASAGYAPVCGTQLNQSFDPNPETWIWRKHAEIPLF